MQALLEVKLLNRTMYSISKNPVPSEKRLGQESSLGAVTPSKGVSYEIYHSQSDAAKFSSFLRVLYSKGHKVTTCG